jgi:hypothetical protein
MDKWKDLERQKMKVSLGLMEMADWAAGRERPVQGVHGKLWV